MTEHAVGTREQWLVERVELLEQEKELTRRSDELARQRRELPWVRIDEQYEFDTDDGRKTLSELFDGRSQLLVYHFMHGPNTPEGCVGCTFAADHFDGAVAHLANHYVTFLCASRSPLETLNAYKRRMGWSFPRVSSAGGDFNRDFSAFTEEDRRDGTGFNFDSPGGASVNVVHDEELMALSAFALEDGLVYHTYSFETGEGTKTLAQLFKVVRSCSSTTSCSAPTGTRAARAARCLRTASTGR